MKTNRTKLRHFAIVAGTIWMTAQGTAQAEIGKPAQQGAGQVRTATAAQPLVILASASCTRVGNRMVC